MTHAQRVEASMQMGKRYTVNELARRTGLNRTQVTEGLRQGYVRRRFERSDTRKAGQGTAREWWLV